MTERRFRAVIRAGDGGGAYVEVPFDVEAEFGRRRVPVVATFEGEAYRGSLVSMGGDGGHALLIRKEIRQRIGRDVGDEVEVTIAEDVQPRVVAVPADVRAALGTNAQARAYFDGLSYTHRREYVEWIEEAKRAETRHRRIEKMLEMLQQKKTR